MIDIIKHIWSILLQKLKSSPLIRSSKSISLLRNQSLSKAMGNNHISKKGSGIHRLVEITSQQNNSTAFYKSQNILAACIEPAKF